MQPIQTAEILNPPEDINVTKILHVYLENMSISDGLDDIDNSLNHFIKIIGRPQAQADPVQISKSDSLKQKLEAIRDYNLTLKTTLEKQESFKVLIKQALECYKEYFLIKFSKDNTPENCDPDIKKILSNFDDNQPFFQSLSTIDDNDISLKLFTKFLNEYLAKLAISAESKINDNNPDQDESEQKKHIDKIKTTLLTFPGGVSRGETIPFACLVGTIQRLQDVIFSLNDSSQELISVNGKVKIFAAQLTPKAIPGDEIHIPSCLLGSLTMDEKKIKEIDIFHNLPKKNIELIEILSFCHSFSEKVKKDLLYPRSVLISNYGLLLEKEVKDENGNKVIKYEEFKSFLEIPELSGFKIDGYGLVNSDAVFEEYTIENSNLISLEQFKEKYLKIPTEKFEEESLRISTLPKIDYLRYIPDPKDLFKISGLVVSIEDEKIKTLIDLFPGKIEKGDDSRIGGVKSLTSEFSGEIKDSTAESEAQDEIAKKSKMFAGLITLRNIFDGYITSINTYSYFLKFDDEFQKKTGETFEDFFFEKELNTRDTSKAPTLKVKAEFSEQESFLEDLKNKIEIQKIAFVENKIFYACIHGLNEQDGLNEQEFRRLIGMVPNLNWKREGKTPLHIACEKGHAKIVEALIRADDINLNEIDEDGDSSLHIACMEGHTEIVKALIGAGADRDVTDSQGKTPLGIACAMGWTEVVKALIEAGADLNKGNMWGETPLQHACVSGHTKIVEALIGADDINLNEVVLYRQTPLTTACEMGHTEIVKKLLEKNADPNIQGSFGNPIMNASFRGKTEIVEILLQHKDINLNIRNKEEDTALFFALKPEGQRNTKTPTREFLEEKEKIALILLNKMDLSQLDAHNKNNSTALTMASQNGFANLVKELIKRGANVIKADKDGDTPVIMAAQFGHIEILKTLLKSGAEPNIKNIKGETAMILARKKGRIEILRTLLESGAEPNIDILDRDGSIMEIENPEIKELIEKYKVTSDIFSESHNIQTLIENINSFKEEDLMEAKSFSFQSKELKLNAIGIINLYKFHKSNTTEVDMIDSGLEEAINSLHRKIKKTNEAPSTHATISRETSMFIEEGGPVAGIKRSASAAGFEPGRR